MTDITDDPVRLTDRSTRVLAEARPGDRLYAIDENGDGWRIVLEQTADARHDGHGHPREGDGAARVLATCDTLRLDEWSNYRVADLHPALEGTGMMLGWDETQGDGEGAHEHVVGIVALIGGWS